MDCFFGKKKTNGYFFVDLTDAVIWAGMYNSKKEFEDHWSTAAMGVKELRKIL
jgi:hypothetical protein